MTGYEYSMYPRAGKSKCKDRDAATSGVVSPCLKSCGLTELPSGRTPSDPLHRPPPQTPSEAANPELETGSRGSPSARTQRPGLGATGLQPVPHRNPRCEILPNEEHLPNNKAIQRRLALSGKLCFNSLWPVTNVTGQGNGLRSRIVREKRGEPGITVKANKKRDGRWFLPWCTQDKRGSGASIRPIMVWKCLCIGHGSPTIIALSLYNNP